AVWTGSLMIVWGGGRATTIGLASGGRYALGQSVDDDGDGVSECEGDCNDQDSAIHPGAEEICNGLDDNCDGTVDEGGNDLCNDNNDCTTDTCRGPLACSHTGLPD